VRSVLALGLLMTLCASANAATVRRSKPPRATYARANGLLSSRDTPFPVGPTNGPGTGWIAPQGQKTDLTRNRWASIARIPARRFTPGGFLMPPTNCVHRSARRLPLSIRSGYGRSYVHRLLRNPGNQSERQLGNDR